MAGLVEQMIKSPGRVMRERTTGAQLEKGNIDGIRRYARHCLVDKSLIKCRNQQADENAPERPPSAYVIFSNSTALKLNCRIQLLMSL